MQIKIPVFIDDKVEPIELIAAFDSSDRIDLYVSVDGVEIPTSYSLLERLSILESDAAQFLETPDKVASANTWEAYRPPSSVDGAVRLGAPKEVVSIADLRTEFEIILDHMTIIIPDPPLGE